MTAQEQKEKALTEFLFERFQKQTRKFAVCCKYCDQKITFIYVAPKNYGMNVDGTRHTCWKLENNRPKMKIIKITAELEVKYLRRKKTS